MRQDRRGFEEGEGEKERRKNDKLNEEEKEAKFYAGVYSFQSEREGRSLMQFS